MTPSPPASDRFGAVWLKRGATPACGSRLSLCTPPGGCSAAAPSGAVTCPSSRQHSGWGGWLGLSIRSFRSGSLFMFSCCRACSVWRDFHPRCDLASPDAPFTSCQHQSAALTPPHCRSFRGSLAEFRGKILVLERICSDLGDRIPASLSPRCQLSEWLDNCFVTFDESGLAA